MGHRLGSRASLLRSPGSPPSCRTTWACPQNSPKSLCCCLLSPKTGIFRTAGAGHIPGVALQSDKPLNGRAPGEHRAPCGCQGESLQDRRGNALMTCPQVTTPLRCSPCPARPPHCSLGQLRCGRQGLSPIQDGPVLTEGPGSEDRCSPFPEHDLQVPGVSEHQAPCVKHYTLQSVLKQSKL